MIHGKENIIVERDDFMLETAMRYSHTLLKECVHEGDTVIDATMGNGHDTLFLSQLVGTTGKVYAFDVQEMALENTKQRLQDHDIHHVDCILDGHEHLNRYLAADELIKGAIFNLGYLPKSDKTIITQPQTTLTALTDLLTHLETKGRIVLVLYYGHPGGETEKEAVLDFCRQLKQEEYSVLTYQFINQKHQPPICLCIEKK